MNYIILPDTGMHLTEGSIVILARFPGIRWILHNGYYFYEDKSCVGWYFSSIPAQTILPVSLDDLKLITVISTGSDGCNCSCNSDNQSKQCSCVCPPPIPPHPPMPPEVIPYTKIDSEYLRRSFITLDTIKERDELDISNLPPGKLIRVNNVDGEPGYFYWSADTANWVKLPNYLDESESDDRYATKTELSIIENQLEWLYLN